MQLFAITTIHLGPGADGEPVIVPAETEFTIDAAEGERLIAVGAAVNPEQRIVATVAEPSAELAQLVAEREELLATIAEARAANEEFHASHQRLTAELEAARTEIASLQAKLVEAGKKK